jgi:F420-dependent oxidoreductase-like protein
MMRRRSTRTAGKRRSPTCGSFRSPNRDHGDHALIKFDLCGTGLEESWKPVLEACRVAERLGFNAFHASDHLMPVGGYDREGAYLESWTLLAALAARTERIRLGVMVTGNTYRHPVVLAKMVTTVDSVSDGRVDFGIGTGWSALDHAPYGIEYPPFRERVERLDEAVRLIKQLWTQRLSDFDGRYYTLRAAPFAPKPLQKPHPPFLIGGSSPSVLALAAREADCWNGLGSQAFVARSLERLDACCAAIGRDPKTLERSLWTDFSLTDSEAESDAVIAQRLAQRAAAEEDPRRKYGLPGESLETIVRGASLIGTPAQIRRQLQGLVEMGLTRFVLRNPRPFDVASTERFAREVMSAFR